MVGSCARADFDGKLSIGAASAASPLGPFTDLGHPLIHDANMGLIDASRFTTHDHVPHVLWKEDCNAVGKPTPIHVAPLADDGLAEPDDTPTVLIDRCGRAARRVSRTAVDCGRFASR